MSNGRQIEQVVSKLIEELLSQDQLHWDPKVAAGPVVLMFADIFTTALYLGLATWILF